MGNQSQWVNSMLLPLLLVFSVGMPTPARTADRFEVVSSSYLGGSDYADAVVGARIQSDGTVVLAANLGGDAERRIGASVANHGTSDRHGCIVRLRPGGNSKIVIRRVAKRVEDLAIDRNDSIYLAAGNEGLFKLNQDGEKTLWHIPLDDCRRVDAAADGHVAAVVGGDVIVIDPAGTKLSTTKGGQFTADVCIDGTSKTVAYCGFRNARAFDGKRRYPVQISYIRGIAYDGGRKWTNYDWSTETDSDRFLNKPENNMADTRGDRCAIGRDGKLYVTFQVAGGNHIFRYSPTDITTKVKLAGGDKHHQFYNSRSEHKCFFGRYEPATGRYLIGQQFCGRLSSGRANAAVTKEGNVQADEQGRVFVVGAAAYGLPLSFDPGGDYTGGGFLLIMSPDLKQRLFCTRLAAGQGKVHAVDARTVDGKLYVVIAGGGVGEGLFAKSALQPKPADPGAEKKDPKDAFFAVLQLR